MKTKIQIASANDAERFDDKLNSKKWETIVEGSPQEALKIIVRMLNSDVVNTENAFLRIVQGATVINL